MHGSRWLIQINDQIGECGVVLQCEMV